MKIASDNTLIPKRTDISSLPGISVMFGVAVIFVVYIALDSVSVKNYPYFFLLPWLCLLAFVLLMPLAYLYFKGRFFIYDPIVFAVLSTFFPGFVIGGIMVVGGLVEQPFLHLIQDPENNLPYTILIIIFGFLGQLFGYFLPFSRGVGARIEKYLPKWEFDRDAYIAPAVLLYLVGTASVAFATIAGVLVIQRSSVFGEYDGLIFAPTQLFAQATFLIAYILFRRGKYDFFFFALMSLMVATNLLRSVFSGSRGTMMMFVISAFIAFFFADPKLTRLRVAVFSCLLVCALLFGMIFATTLRNVKETDARVSFDQYTDNVTQTFDQLGKSETFESLTLGLQTLAMRADALTSLAVVVSSYENLAPYEASYGLDNNIVRDLSIFLVPRFLWKDKPTESDARAYSDLYFNYGASSFVITPFGDLIRNFGPVGVPIGMFFFGFLLRVIYRALVENQPKITWRIVLYYMLLTNVGYEWFYGGLISNLFRVCIVSIVGLCIIYFVARFLGNTTHKVVGV